MEVIKELFNTFLDPGLSYYISMIVVFMVCSTVLGNWGGVIGTIVFVVYKVLKSIMEQSYYETIVYSLPLIILFVYLGFRLVQKIIHACICGVRAVVDFVDDFIYDIEQLYAKKTLKKMSIIIEKYLNKHGVVAPYMFDDYMDKKHKRKRYLYIGKSLLEQYYPKKYDIIHTSRPDPDAGILKLIFFEELALSSCYPQENEMPDGIFFNDLIVLVYNKLLIQKCEQKIYDYVSRNMITNNYILNNAFDSKILGENYKCVFLKKNGALDEDLLNEMILSTLQQLTYHGFIKRIDDENDVIYQPVYFESNNVKDMGTYTID